MTDIFSEPLPAPRLQLRWRKPTKRDLRKKSVLGAPPDWICDYELVLPLKDGDIRRPKGKSEIVVPLGSTRTQTSAEAVIYAPFRDGAHAWWDSQALGNLPIFVLGSDGNARKQEPRI